MCGKNIDWSEVLVVYEELKHLKEDNLPEFSKKVVELWNSYEKMTKASKRMYDHLMKLL
jgi:hypothetical protein